MARTHIVGKQTHAGPIADRSPGIARALIRDLFGPTTQRHFNVRYWDGTVERGGEDNTPRFTLILKRPEALRRMLLPPSQLAIGEAYLRDHFDIEGSMEEAVATADRLAERLGSPLALARVAARVLALPAGTHKTVADQARGEVHLEGGLHSRKRDAAAVRYHYDVGNDFYALWLDKQMVYSCAYFDTGTESVDQAQEAKLDYICRKLRLQPGERLLDIGCGWGGLVRHAARHYGVKALGITLSEPQAALARQRIVGGGLEHDCRVEIRDYRELDEAPFDKIVSVGMVEHVGHEKLPLYFKQAYKLLKPGGLFLNHGIVTVSSGQQGLGAWARSKLWREGEFISKYVFPDGDLIPTGQVLDYAEDAGFEVRDVESLREHYALTLRHWVSRLEEHHEEAARLVGEPTYRVWRMYMSGSAHGFASGSLGIVQSLLSKQKEGGESGLPLTRADLY